MKQHIRAFAFSRKQAINRLESYSEQLNEYIIKCIIFGKYREESYNHWLYEVCTWIHTCDGADISGAKLKEKDYENSIFGYFAETKQETKENLLNFKVGNLYRSHKKNPTGALPYYSINNEMIDCLYGCYTDIKDVCVPLLKSAKVHPLTLWKKLLKSFVDSYVYNFQDDDIVENIYDE